MITTTDYFNRQIQLWGEEKQALLQDKKIAIIGSGGLGCSLAMALGTSGIGQIDIVDFDTIALHNIHRQIAFKLKDNGKYKAEVVVELLKEKNPFLKTHSYLMRFEEFKELNMKYDLVLDATDNLNVRYEIDNYAKSTHIPWIYGSVEEFNGHVSFFDKANFKIFNPSDHKVSGNIAPMVMHVASLQANLAIRYLTNLPIIKDKLYYLYFNKEGELITQKFNIPIN